MEEEKQTEFFKLGNKYYKIDDVQTIFDSRIKSYTEEEVNDK